MPSASEVESTTIEEKKPWNPEVGKTLKPFKLKALCNLTAPYTALKSPKAPKKALKTGQGQLARSFSVGDTVKALCPEDRRGEA